MTEQEAQDERERRFWASMARHARAEHAREPIEGDGYSRYLRVVNAYDKASFALESREATR